MRVILNTIEKVKDFVAVVNHSPCDVDLISGKSTYLDAKSILGILSCNIKEPLSIEIFGGETDKEALIHNIERFVID